MQSSRRCSDRDQVPDQIASNTNRPDLALPLHSCDMPSGKVVTEPPAIVSVVLPFGPVTVTVINVARAELQAKSNIAIAESDLVIAENTPTLMSFFMSCHSGCTCRCQRPIPVATPPDHGPSDKNLRPTQQVLHYLRSYTWPFQSARPSRVQKLHPVLECELSRFGRFSCGDYVARR